LSGFGFTGNLLLRGGVAADGLIGLEVARREHPIVIVSDMNMPGMGGVEMIRALAAISSSWMSAFSC
jgi:CheY-like chemotaxis protein